ncbi:hypothetical protein [Microbacterium sp. Root553]|uniref:hypothetical protein n=1 Tax=Microbacterium sp. Root553 TaxID=1736556 RepID=UPI0006FDB498|nr:hypothetical protein [Microbacterium sp. Root553]KQZ22312.1 hypothetical protein ASD43_16500 [Microbacterium sp. Root553]
MIQPTVLVSERVRQRLRAEGTDPTLDAETAHGIALAEVRRYNDAALARGGTLIDDEPGCVRDVLAAAAVVVDGATAAFDITEITIPIAAGYLYLSSLFGLAVTVPNVPTPRALLRRDLR